MINLLTNKQKKVVYHTRILRIWIAIIIGTISLISVSLILFFPTFLVINGKYNEAKEEEKKIQTSFSVTSESVEELSKKISSIVGMFSGPVAPSTLDYIAILEEKKVPGVSVSRIQSDSRDKRTITIGGIAASRAKLQQYELSFRNDLRVEKVESPVSNYVKTQNTVFVFTITFK
jgi:hypothetical protein